MLISKSLLPPDSEYTKILGVLLCTLHGVDDSDVSSALLVINVRICSPQLVVHNYFV